MKKFLKNLLLRNYRSDFEIISQECSLGDPFQKFFAKFLSVYKYGSGEWGLFALYGLEEILKKLFFQNCFSDFEIILQDVPWVTVFKICSQNFYLSINMALVNGGFLHYTDMKKYLKILVLRNRWSDFEIISQESGFDIRRRPDCLIRAAIATGKLP